MEIPEDLTPQVQHGSKAKFWTTVAIIVLLVAGASFAGLKFVKDTGMFKGDVGTFEEQDAFNTASKDVELTLKFVDDTLTSITEDQSKLSPADSLTVTPQIGSYRAEFTKISDEYNSIISGVDAISLAVKTLTAKTNQLTTMFNGKLDALKKNVRTLRSTADQMIRCNPILSSGTPDLSCPPTEGGGTTIVGTLPPQITVDTTSIEFGDVEVETNSFKNIQIANSGTVATSVILSITPNTNLFQIHDSGGNELDETHALVVGASATKIAILTFHPLKNESITSTLNIKSGGLTINIPITATGIIAEAPLDYTLMRNNITVTPASLDFGTVKYGDTKNLDFTIKNTTAQTTINLNLSMSGEDTTYFSEQGSPTIIAFAPYNGSQITLNGGESKVITIQFMPKEKNGAGVNSTFNAKIVVTASNPALTGDIPIALSGTGTADTGGGGGGGGSSSGGHRRGGSLSGYMPNASSQYYLGAYGYDPFPYVPIPDQVNPPETVPVEQTPTHFNVTKTGPEMAIYPLLLLASGLMARRFRKK